MESHTRVLGEFGVTGPLVVADPCLDRASALSGIVDNVVRGRWRGYAEYVPDDLFPLQRLVRRLEARHSLSLGEPPAWRETDILVGVDSSRAGIFNAAAYPRSRRGCELFFDRVIAATGGGILGGILKEGVVSASGFGDGRYSCDIHRNDDGLADAIRITFFDYDTEPQSST